jgi:hypothetical protein
VKVAMIEQRGARAGLGVIALALFFVGGIFVAIGGSFVFNEWNYWRHGVRAEAAAIGKSLRFATDTSDTGYELSYEVVVDGRRRERTEGVPARQWERVETGTVLPVEHLRGRPETLRIAPDSLAIGLPSVFAAIGVGLILGGVVAAVRTARPSPFSRGDAADPMPVSVAPADNPSYWTLARRTPVFWVGAMFLLVGTTMLAIGVSHIYGEWRFSTDARAIEGMVLTKERKRSGRNHQSTRYEATYRFTIADATFEGRTRIPYEQWTPLIERQPVTVRYLPEAPSTSRLDGSRTWPGATIPALLGCLFTAIGAWLFVGTVRSAKLEWRLRRHGVPGHGTVVDVRDRRLKINGVQQWRLRFEYDDSQGLRHAGSHDLAEHEALLWKTGDVGSVLYDPRKPSDAIWLGTH